MLRSLSREHMIPVAFLALLGASYALRVPSKLKHETVQKLMKPASAKWTDISPLNTYAVLMAGSREFYNYRHQADIAHAYQVLTAGGVPRENIVVLAYDDIASHPDNPYPGRIFNRPGGPDVYNGLEVDYYGQNCTAETFYNVLRGNATGLEGLGSGRFLSSGPSDRVFIYYSDHGGVGILGAPSGDFIYADKLVSALLDRYSSNGFSELVFYLEACESGSIFEGMLPPGVPVYATTASSADESSWACYCPGSFDDPDYEFPTCLGDLYSVAWMEDVEGRDARAESLEGQFLRVKLRTSSDYTYVMGSHALQFGAFQSDIEPVALYQGWGNATGSQGQRPQGDGGWGDAGGAGPGRGLSGGNRVRQRDAKMMYLRNKLRRAASPSERAALEAQLAAEASRRQGLEQAVRGAIRAAAAAAAAGAATDGGASLAAPLGRSTGSVARVPAAAGVWARLVAGALKEFEPLGSGAGGKLGSGGPSGGVGLDLEKVLLRKVVGREPGSPLVSDYACYRAALRSLSDSCGHVAPSGLTQEDTDLAVGLVNLCNAGAGVGGAALWVARGCGAVTAGSAGGTMVQPS